MMAQPLSRLLDCPVGGMRQMADRSGSIASVGVYSLFLCSVFAYGNGWRVGLKFHFF